MRLFQEDVKQVLDWLQNHGEVFLRKNIGIGRNLAKARAYQKSHETFEGKNFLLVMLATVVTKVELIWEPALNQEFTGFPAKI